MLRESRTTKRGEERAKFCTEHKIFSDMGNMFAQYRTVSGSIHLSHGYSPVIPGFCLLWLWLMERTITLAVQ
jgi:hypothetical protein